MNTEIFLCSNESTEFIKEFEAKCPYVNVLLLFGFCINDISNKGVYFVRTEDKNKFPNFYGNVYTYADLENLIDIIEILFG